MITIKTAGAFEEYTAHIQPKTSITVERGNSSNTFKIGDWAEYDSYNLSYTGIIRSITEKTVTIEAYPDSQNARKHRLKISQFCWRNWNFDAERISKENADTMMYI